MHVAGKKHRPLPAALREKIDLYFCMVLSTWKGAMDALGHGGHKEHIHKRKEAVGWACSAARVVAEESAAEGLSLADCLRRAAAILMDKADELDDG